MTKLRIYPLAILALASLPLLAQAESTQTLPTLYVDAQQTANIRPVTTYESPVSNLEFEPRVDLQSRNMAEAQGDITIRGGIFEGTGFRVGSATLIDPQTGHYSTELPIAPEMLTRPKILTGSENALYGFNSTAGTISYGWSQIQDGGSLTLGGGDHDLNFQRIHNGLTGQLGESSEWSWGVEAEISRSESDGTIEYGDHDFSRGTTRLQIIGPDSQTDFVAGYQHKIFTWPGMYTGEARRFTEEGTGISRLRYENENVKTRLFLINHSFQYDVDNHFSITAYNRRHSDHFIFDRPKPSIYSETHETLVTTCAISGKHLINEAFKINYSAQISSDEIDSTSYENNFTSRNYTKISLLPEYHYTLKSGSSLITQFGLNYFDTNRNSSKLAPLVNFAWEKTTLDGNRKNIYLSYDKTFQTAGYTAIGGSVYDFKEHGNPNAKQPLFASNRDLDTEISQNLEIGFNINSNSLWLRTALFYRWDDNLTDWVYNKDADSARLARAIDVKTFGIEMIASKSWNTLEAITSYNYLEKDINFGPQPIELNRSFYAGNYAKHRFTLGAIWTPCEIFQFRIDNEWRENEDNDLRLGSDSALFTHLGLSIYPPQFKNMELFFAIDNAWDDDFQDVPSTPGRGDQYSAGLTYSW